MNICFLPSTVTPDRALHLLTTYLVNDRIAIDAGSLGIFATPQDQARIKHVFISHYHADHVATLPIFLDNVAGQGDSVTVYASEAVLDCLRRDLFSDRMWPDFFAFERDGVPFVRAEILTAGKPVSCADLMITPVPVNHPVPTLGFLIDDGKNAVMIASDTGPTEEIWRRANQLPHLRGVFLEASFPEELTWLAERAGHLTPRLFASELKKLKSPVRVIAVHVKARYHNQVVAELGSLGLSHVEVARPGEWMHFGN